VSRELAAPSAIARPLERIRDALPPWIVVSAALILLTLLVLAPDDALDGRAGAVKLSFHLGLSGTFANDEQGPLLLLILVVSVIATAAVPATHRPLVHLAAGVLAVGLLLGPVPLAGLIVVNVATYLWLELRRPGWVHGLGVLIAVVLWLVGEPRALVAGTLCLAAIPGERLFAGRPTARRYLSLLVVHAIPLGLFVVAMGDMLDVNSSFRAPLWVILAGWQWWRLVLYRADRLGDDWREEISFLRFCWTLMGLGFFVHMNMYYYIGKGHRYIEKRTRPDRHGDTMRRGAWLMLWAVVLLTLYGWVEGWAEDLANVLDVSSLSGYDLLGDSVRAGVSITRADVLFVGLRSLLVAFFFFAGLSHLKVSIWRLHGYDLEPHFRFPFLSTNLVTLWSRWFYYYREFLIRAFYWPTFFTFFRNSPRLRVCFATFVAAGLGNQIAHLVIYLLIGQSSDMDIERLLSYTPYYVLLGGSIAATQFYLLMRGRRRRKPWTRGPAMLVDVASVAAVFLHLSIIRVFTHTWTTGDWMATPLRMIRALIVGEA